MKRTVFFLLLIVVCSCGQTMKEIDLSGEWAFTLDPNDKGLSEQWYNTQLPGTVNLPGSLQEQGFGNDISVNTQWSARVNDSAWFKSKEYEPYRQPGNIKISFWLQPEKEYVGVAWFQKEVTIPSSWKGQYVELELERTHWETTLFVNGKEAGKNNALLTPHRYAIEETGKVLLTLRVDNRIHIPVGINAHSVSDHTQSNWNGIIGKIAVTPRPALYIDAVRVYPDVKAKKARVEIDLAGNVSDKAKISLKAHSINNSSTSFVKPVSVEANNGRATAELDLGEGMLTWSEYTPNVYRLDVELLSNSGKELKSVDFGMREIKADGTRFTVNGIPVFLRGTLECCIFPLTGYPAMDEEYWTKIYRRCKEFGLNHVRFHSWCPPKVAFEIADREGIYLQVECGGWTAVGNGNPSDEWFYEESERIVKEYGNHPSFCMFLYGNEPGGRNRDEYLAKFIDYWKAKDQRFVYTGGAGWPYLPNADYWSTFEPRVYAQRQSPANYLNDTVPHSSYDWRERIKDKTMPTISHEIGQWCVYPNFNEIQKYTGILKAKNFEVFRDFLAKHNIGDMSEKFLFASGRLQTLAYKADIEAALRTPGFGGFQLLDLHDFPGQGTALVGVLDPFWDTKGYVDGKEFSNFCNSVVPLARMDKFVWLNNETFKADIEVAHFADKQTTGATVEWKLTDVAKNIIGSGKTTKDFPINNCIKIASIEQNLESIVKPSQLILTVSISGTEYSNSWNVWVYPANPENPANKPYFTTNIDDAVAKAQAGDNVLYCPSPALIESKKSSEILVGFSPVFWNTSWFPGQKPNTLGVYCDASHPALSSFPNDGYSDYQWYEIVKGSIPLIMNEFPAAARPVVYIIDDWFRANKLGLLLEAKVGKGKLMICGTDLNSDINKRPAARQFRNSIEQYMASDKFNPATELDLELMRALLK